MTSVTSRIRDYFRGFALRQIRIFCGLVMFCYLLSHFTNHALGNVSYAAIKQGLTVHMAIWRFPPLAFLLYSAALVHASLGLWALYERRHFRWKGPEIAQLVLGLSIPALMLQHLIELRLPALVWETNRNYAHAFSNYFLTRPDQFLMMIAGLVVAWTHGCIGLFFWLRMRWFYKRLAPFLLAGAVLLPALALLGVSHAGREYAELQKSPEWREREITQPTTPARWQQVNDLKDYALMIYLGLILLVFAARGARELRERRGGMIQLSYPGGRRVEVPRGYSVLEASLHHGIPHASVCGGRARCSTCRIRILGDCSALPRPSRRESAVLNRVGAGTNPAVRLACQLRPDADLVLIPLLPPDTNAGWLTSTRMHRGGEERYLVSMFIDMRGSTQLAETRLPFDTVFIVNQFVSTISAAVVEAGGSPNQFVGDGMLALFGLVCDREPASRQALRAVLLIAQGIDELNSMLKEDLPHPIEFGIGVHGGKVIIGDIGYRDHFVFTALGDAVNVTARLQDMTKELQCEVIVSDEVRRASGLAADVLASTSVSIRGRSAQLTICKVTKARNMMAAG